MPFLILEPLQLQLGRLLIFDGLVMRKLSLFTSLAPYSIYLQMTIMCFIGEHKLPKGIGLGYYSTEVNHTSVDYCLYQLFLFVRAVVIILRREIGPGVHVWFHGEGLNSFCKQFGTATMLRL